MKNYTIDRNELANWLDSQYLDIPTFESWDAQNCPTAIFLSHTRVQEKEAEETFSVSTSGQVTLKKGWEAFRDLGNIDRFFVAFEQAIDRQYGNSDYPRSLPVTPRQAKQVLDKVSQMAESYEVESIIRLLCSLEQVDLFNLTPDQQKKLEPLK
jgi:hypothetical protein